jgi:hypothetical protein
MQVTHQLHSKLLQEIFVGKLACKPLFPAVLMHAEAQHCSQRAV